MLEYTCCCGTATGGEYEQVLSAVACALTMVLLLAGTLGTEAVQAGTHDSSKGSQYLPEQHRRALVYLVLPVSTEHGYRMTEWV